MANKPEKSEKHDGLLEVVKALNKKFGIGTIAPIDDTVLKLQRAKTGIVALDLALGGGLPKSTIVEIFGEEGLGKSTIALKLVASMQSMGKQVAWIDLEHAMDIDWAKKLGVNTEWLLLSQPDTGEDAVDIIDSLVRSRALGLVVLDSIAACVPSVEIDTSASDQQMGVAARLMNKMVRRLHSALQPGDILDKDSQNECVVVLINQTRERIGVTYGDPTTTCGGKGVRFGSHIRIKLYKGEMLQKEKEIVGRTIKFRTIKNKTYKPFVSGEFKLFFEDGRIDNNGVILIEAVKLGLVAKSGPFYKFDDKNYHGEKAFVAAVLSNPVTKEKLLSEIYRRFS